MKVTTQKDPAASKRLIMIEATDLDLVTEGPARQFLLALQAAWAEYQGVEE